MLYVMDDPGAGLANQFAASSEQIAGLYEKWSVDGEYDRDMETWGYDAPERVAALVEAALGRVSGTVLDAGCGTGRLGRALHDLGISDVWGGDFSAASTRVALSSGHYAEVGHLDLNGPLGFADGRFAVTASVGVFSYVRDTAAAIGELLRVVQPGGSVIFTQRTDLWEQRDDAGLLRRLEDAGTCIAVVSEPKPYLPGHPDFGTEIGIRLVTLTQPG